MAEARGFARQLTSAQQQALLALPAAWGVALDLEDQDCPPAMVMAELDQLGLAYLAKSEGYLATRRGLEIRDQLTGGADFD